MSAAATLIFAASALPPQEILLRLGLAAVFAMVLGIEREKPHRAAGLRTHVLVGLGAGMFVVCAMCADISADASSRVIQGVVQGIGFLGAGTIFVLSDRAEVRGLTTAASIWVTAAIGIAAGLGEFWVAGIGAGLAFLALRPMKYIETHLFPPGDGKKNKRARTSGKRDDDPQRDADAP